MEEDGTLSAERRIGTPQDVDADGLFAAVARLCEECLAEGGGVSAIGVGCGGPMRFPQGIVSPLHIPAWRDYPLRARLVDRFAMPCLVDNDAKAFALGEWWRGSGAGARSLLGIVVSTGVGGGIVVDGQLLHGAGGNAGHVGHVIAVPGGPRCACGADGCVEAVASGSAIARRYGEGVDAVRVAELARSRDDRAQKLFREAGVALARGVVAAAALCDLDRVVIGGGVALGAWDLLAPPLEYELRAAVRLDFIQGLEVRRAALGHRSGLLGAAALALRHQP